VLSCEGNDFDGLFAGTRQIFGMCSKHGVGSPSDLFAAYRLVVSWLFGIFEKRDLVVSFLHDLVWKPAQVELARLVGWRRAEWRSMLLV